MSMDSIRAVISVVEELKRVVLDSCVETSHQKQMHGNATRFLPWLLKPIAYPVKERLIKLPERIPWCLL